MESTRVIFLDIDGVLNCDTFYHTEQAIQGRKELEGHDLESFEGNSAYCKAMICRERVGWLNKLCEDTNACVVISSTWRGSGLEYCQKALIEAGATFDIIDVTPWLKHEACVRGNEIRYWLVENSVKLFGVSESNFRDYAIIDDDSDMLLWQTNHFFKTDGYSGLTPNICYKIKRFFSGNKNIANT